MEYSPEAPLIAKKQSKIEEYWGTFKTPKSKTATLLFIFIVLVILTISSTVALTFSLFFVDPLTSIIYQDCPSEVIELILL